MHAARRAISYKDYAAAKHFSEEPVWYRLRTREWDFFVANEVEAFAVLARHDVEAVDKMTIN
jgi:hypothetical protein